MSESTILEGYLGQQENKKPLEGDLEPREMPSQQQIIVKRAKGEEYDYLKRLRSRTLTVKDLRAPPTEIPRIPESADISGTPGDWYGPGVEIVF